MSQEPDTKGRAPKTDIWPPPPKNQPELPPSPAPRSGEGLDALIMSVVAGVLLLIVSYSLASHVNDATGFDLLCIVLVITCWVTAIIWGLMSWRTRFGPFALLICIVELIVDMVAGPQ